MKRKDKHLLFLLFFLYALTRIAFFAKTFIQVDGFAIPDDAYISLDIARNFASGKWFFYGGQHTSGFQPLYVFIMTPVFLLFKTDLLTPVYFSLAMSSFTGFGTVYFLYKSVRLVYEDDYSPFVSVLLFVLLPVTAANISNGLETSLSFFFFVLVFYCVYKNRAKEISSVHLKGLFLFGVLVGTAMLARIDNIMVIPGILIFAFLKGRNEKYPFSLIVRKAAIFTAGVAFIYFPYMVISYSFTGDLLPASGKAVHQIGSDMINYHLDGQSGFFALFQISIKNIYTNYSLVIIFAVVSTFVYRLKTLACPWFKVNVTEHTPIIITSLLLFVSYTFYFTANWFYSRYFFPLSLFFIILTAFANNQLMSGFNSPKSKLIVFAVTVLVLISANLIRPGVKDFFFKQYTRKGYYEIGSWANSNFPEGTTIGTNQSGALGYFSKNVKVINLDGVVNVDAYNAIKNKELIEYIKSQKIEYFIDWEINYEFIKRNSKNIKDGDIVLINSAGGLKSWDYEWFVYRVNY